MKPDAQRVVVPEGVISDSRLAMFSRSDWILVGCGVALTFAICLRLGTGRLLWEDEVLGWMMLKDPSWRHVWYSWQQGADGGGALFYIAGRSWFRVFGASVTAFRMFSATFFSAALLLLWKAARLYYPTRCVAFAVGVTWFLSPALLPHFAEGRFYGLFLASCAAVILVVLRSFQAPVVSRLALLVFLANSALITSHILGIAYSACMLVAWIVADFLQGHLRWRLYLAAVASWLWIIPSYPAIAASAAVGRPHFWTVQPDLRLFLLAYTGSSLRTSLVLVLLLAAVALQTLVKRNARDTAEGLRSRRPILIVMAALLAIPVVFYAEGLFGPPLFNERYLQPVEAGIIILFAELALQLDFAWKLLRRFRSIPLALAATALLLLILHYGLVYLPNYIDLQSDYSAALSGTLPPAVPVVCEDAFTFTELMPVESQSPVRYMFLLDWDNSISSQAPRLEVTQYHLMQNWKKVGYFADHIRERDDFLAEHPYFLVLHTDQNDRASLSRKASSSARRNLIGNPLAARFSADNQYQTLPFSVTEYGRLRESVTLVCRRDVNCQAVMSELKAKSAGSEQSGKS